MLIRTEEWLAAHDAVTAADPDVTNPDHGVAVVVWSGQRHWYAWSDKVVVMTAGVDAGDEQDMEMPVQRRLVSFALPLSYVGDVSLAVDGTHTTVLGAGNCRHFDQPDTTIPSQPRWDEGAVAEAQLPADSLRGLLNVCRVLLDGVDTHETRVPSFDMSITATGLAVHIAWGAAGVPETHLNVDAKTSGSAARSVWAPGVVQLLAALPLEGDVEVRMPTTSDVVIVQTERWSASIATGNSITDVQLTLFDPTEYLVPTNVDPLPGLSLRDVCKLAKDSDPEVRMKVAASHWNWDVRLQRVLATDPDERVVRALLDHVDLSSEVFELIVGGRHVRLRRDLAWCSDLPTELIERLAADDDRITRGRAASELASRAAAAGYPRCTVCSSWDVQRHVEGFRVWFTCNRCGAVFS